MDLSFGFQTVFFGEFLVSSFAEFLVRDPLLSKEISKDMTSSFVLEWWWNGYPQIITADEKPPEDE